MFGKRTEPLPIPEEQKIVLGLMWCLKPSAFSNLVAMSKLPPDKKNEEMVFGTTRTCGHGIFWQKLISMELATEGPPTVDFNADHLKDASPEYLKGLKNLASYKPTPAGKEMLLSLLSPAQQTGWPPKDSVISPEAIQILQANIDEGGPLSQSKMAYLLERGLGMEKNLDAAFKLHLAAAEKGVSASMDAVAEMYFRSQGTPQDNKEALKWFRAAADHGNRPAMVKLGHIFTGNQDQMRAYIWYSAAVKYGVNCVKERDNALSKLPKEQLRAANLFLEVWQPDERPVLF